MICTADAVEVMALVAACHHRTAPRMDDREVVLTTASVWAELFNEHKFELPDLIAAVKQRAKGISEAPEPADIIRVARAIRAERNEREALAELEARQSVWEAKGADDTPAIAPPAPALLGKSTPRLDRARAALQTCRGKQECRPALAEYTAALAEARTPKKKRRAS